MAGKAAKRPNGTVVLRADARAFKVECKELARRLAALELFTREVKKLVAKGLTARGFEFTHRELPAAPGARVQVIELHVAGALHRALTALRAAQGNGRQWRSPK